MPVFSIKQSILKYDCILVTLAGVAVFGSILFRGIFVCYTDSDCGYFWDMWLLLSAVDGGFHTGCECPYICHSNFSSPKFNPEAIMIICRSFLSLHLSISAISDQQDSGPRSF